MRQWLIRKGAQSLDDMALVEVPQPAPGPGEVAVRVRACSLNYRDQLIPLGHYFGGTVDRDTVPLSDGAGEIVAVGKALPATQWGPGRRAVFPELAGWAAQSRCRAGAGRTAGHRHVAGLGDPARTWRGALRAKPVVRTGRMPALCRCHRMECLDGRAAPGRAGQSVLVLGTGGVSLLAAQIALAAGARVIATSSSDEKLERVRALGVQDTINYRTTPEWGARGRTGRRRGGSRCGSGRRRNPGAEHPGGRLRGRDRPDRSADPQRRYQPAWPDDQGRDLRGIFVGSAGMARRLNSFVDEHGIRPVVDRTFAMDQAVDAWRYQASAGLFGKVVITV
jgi:NADPH:quinone reductase-like Zn-dependent oxidoreductase